AIIIEVGHQAHMVGRIPALVRSKITDHQSRSGEASVAVRQGCPDAIITKRNNVSLPIIIEIGHQAHMTCWNPALVRPKITDDKMRCRKTSIAVRQGGPYSIITERHNVSPPIIVEIGHQAFMT